MAAKVNDLLTQILSCSCVVRGLDKHSRQSDTSPGCQLYGVLASIPLNARVGGDLLRMPRAFQCWHLSVAYPVS